MNNYEYIIASLPVISRYWKPADGATPEDLISMIKSQCSKSDNGLIDTLIEGYDDSKLDADFYRTVTGHHNRFLKEYFNFDLIVRNAKVRYLNSSLGRHSEEDIFMAEREDDPDKDKVDAAFQTKDILDRERAVDELMWNRISEINTFDTFNIEAILGFIAKLHIVARWLQLDANSGREMFSKLLSEVRGTFEGVKYDG